MNVSFDGIYDPALAVTTNIKRFDVSADGTRLAAIGNFSTAGGLTRSQLAVLDIEWRQRHGRLVGHQPLRPGAQQLRRRLRHVHA